MVQWLARAVVIVAAAAGTKSSVAQGQAESVSAWDAADFRIWGFIPDWTPISQINGFPSEGVYNHVSDVLYFSGVRPTATGGLVTTSAGAGHLAALKSHTQQYGFRFHMSMFTVSGGETDAVWESIIGNRSYRSNFVNNVKNLLLANNMTGFNFDWERPNSAAEWGDYTQLARELRAAINPLGMEVSVCDYGSTDARWDDTALFDARVYDQLFIMGYHYGATSNASFANGKLNLKDQGADKAFKNEQLVLGIGTWGDNGPATVSLKSISAVNPNLPGGALTFTGTVNDLSGNPRSGTWDVESRYQVREKVQLALDRNMPGVMSWTLHYDAVNKMSLHRVAHHYTVFKRAVPDLNLDGRVDAADANALADNMGTVPGWKGTATAAQFENFYWSGNWEKGDRDGNGFVNQLDADWLADRYAALEVVLPDRLPYTGSFEKLQHGQGLSGRWQAARAGSGKLLETGNFAQHNAGFLSFAGVGAGANKFSASSLTIRNQNSAEAYDSLNTQPRSLSAGLSTPIDLGANQTVYLTFLIRQNTGPLLASQLNSTNRNLTLSLLDAAGASQTSFTFQGKQQQFGVASPGDPGGETDLQGGFAPDATYMFVARISGNGSDANAIEASLFADGAAVGNFTDPNFEWMLAAQNSSAFNPVLTQLQFVSSYQANFTVSNVWMGSASDFFNPPMAGDFNADGTVDGGDLGRWRSGLGMQSGATHWQGDANGDGAVDGQDFLIWQRNLGATGAGAANAVPEPAAAAMAWLAAAVAVAVQRSR